MPLLWDTLVRQSCRLVGHSCGTLLRVALVKHSRTRLPPKVTCQSPKTSISYETSSKKSSGKPHRSTHITQACQAVLRVHPLRTTPLTRQPQCRSDILLHHKSQPRDSLRLPRTFTCPHVYHAQSTAPATKCDLRPTS